MTENNPSDKTEQTPPLPRRKRRWWKWLVALLVLVILLGVGVIAAFPLTGPYLVRWAAELASADYWDGAVDVERVDAGYYSPVVLHNLKLRDNDGRVWATVKAVRLHIDGWPGIYPVLREIEVDSPSLNAYADEGAVRLPLTLPEQKEESGPVPFVDIRRVVINNIRAELRTGLGPVGKAETDGAVMLQNLRLAGEATMTGNMVVHLGENARIESDLRGEANLSRLVIRDLRELLDLDPIDTVKPLVLEDVQLPNVRFQNGRLEIPRFRFRSCQGQVGGRLDMHIRPDSPTRTRGRLTCQRLDLAKVMASYDPTQDVRYGLLSAKVQAINQVGWDAGGINLDGAVALDDSDLDRTDVIGDIFMAMGIGDDKTRSDLYTVFSVRNGLLTFKEGRLGNSLTALDVEPGGTVDLRNGKLDFHVVGGLFSQLGKLPGLDLGELPGLNAITGLTKKLMRLWVTGDWHDPQVTKRPARDLAEGAVGFFGDMLKSGGQLGEGLLNLGNTIDKP